MPFGGKTYDRKHDGARLLTLLHRAQNLRADCQWRTLAEIQTKVGGSEASVSARLRDLRKSKLGGYTVERRRDGKPELGIWEYRLTGEQCPNLGPPKPTRRQLEAELSTLRSENARLLREVRDLRFNPKSRRTSVTVTTAQRSLFV